MESNEVIKCVLCGCECKHGGCNPYPLSEDGRCCHKCNEKVIEARWAEQFDVAFDELVKGDSVTVHSRSGEKTGKFNEICKTNDERGYVMVIDRDQPRRSGHPGINDPGSWVIPTREINSVIRT